MESGGQRPEGGDLVGSEVADSREEVLAQVPALRYNVIRGTLRPVTPLCYRKNVVDWRSVYDNTR